MTERPPLNEYQQKILTFVSSYIDKHGWAPSVREIGTAVERKSTAMVLADLRQLEMKGYLVRGQHQVRAIRVIP